MESLSEDASNDQGAQSVIRVSLVVPIFGRHSDAQDILEKFSEVVGQFESAGDVSVVAEVIFVDDGSALPLKSTVSLRPAKEQTIQVRIIRFSRNFGQHSALLCGLREASGEFVVRCNSDDSSLFGHIPTILEQLMTKNAERCALVHSIGISRISRLVRKLENYALGIQSPVGTSSLRGYSRKFVDCLLECASSNNYLLELEDWIGFATTYIPTSLPVTTGRNTTYSFSSKLNLLTEILTLRLTRSFQMVAFVSLIAVTANLFIGIGLLLLGLTGRVGGNGFVSLAIVQTASLAVQLLALAMIGLVTSATLQESQDRPSYIIAEK